MSRAEVWIRCMVEDGFAFCLIVGGDRRKPGDYDVFKRGQPLAAPMQGPQRDRLDQSAGLIAALGARASSGQVESRSVGELVVT